MIDSWIQTYTGKKFWPLSPIIQDIDIIDIAHSLSMQCRFNGHCIKFYSVAEHSYWMAEAARKMDRSGVEILWCLLHDSPEAYLCDVPSPIKGRLEGFYRMEMRLMRAVASRFGLSWPEPKLVKELDYRILATEKKAMLSKGPEWTREHVPLEPLDVNIVGMAPQASEYWFMRTFGEIMKGAGK